ncbi:MAG: CPBP family intramembrane metalloprotease [Candidatus Hydrogenedentes bacterium]|nr:CPBP family intramembrane metalloprotease [Candidatus Hydrogenedentota bacterium]
MTLLFSLGILAVYFVCQIIVVAAFMVAHLLRHGVDGFAPEVFGEQVAQNGLFISSAVVAGAPAGLALVLAAIRLRKRGSYREYLRLIRPSSKTLLAWSFSGITFMLLLDALRVALGQPLIPEEVLEWYKTAGSLPLMWLAFVFVAPIFEEVWFRGFMLRGLAASRIGTRGAILLSAIFWALLHLHYDLFGVATIFVFGLILGAAQVRTGSLYVPIAMHALNNTLATLETAWFASHSQ